MSDELKYPDNFANWPETWQSCFEDGVQAERRRLQEAKPVTSLAKLTHSTSEDYAKRQEAKPMTVEQIEVVIDVGLEQEQTAFEIAQRIHAALLPAQSQEAKPLRPVAWMLNGTCFTHNPLGGDTAAVQRDAGVIPLYALPPTQSVRTPSQEEITNLLFDWGISYTTSKAISDAILALWGKV